MVNGNGKKIEVSAHQPLQEFEPFWNIFFDLWLDDDISDTTLAELCYVMFLIVTDDYCDVCRLDLAHTASELHLVIKGPIEGENHGD